MDHLRRLFWELEAIELWNANYHRSPVRDQLDIVAFNARKSRRRKILEEIMDPAKAEVGSMAYILSGKSSE